MPVGGPRCARGRSSKVQNNVLRVCVGSQSLDVYFELQALLHKDANTVAHALRAVVDYITKVALPGVPANKKLRVVHLITGDGVPTNMAAMASKTMNKAHRSFILNHKNAENFSDEYFKMKKVLLVST